MRTGSINGGTKNPANTTEDIVARGNSSPGGGSLAVIGIGPGSFGHMTFRAQQAIREAQVVVAYHGYLPLIEDLLEGQEVIASGMTREVERCRMAVDKAVEGFRVAVVSSGDPGIYGMAGLVLEMVYRLGCQDELEVEVIPGVTAASAAAAVLGAPLMHDFAVISLSDRLTPWEVIVRRVDMAAHADFVLVLYNPRSKQRSHQIYEVQQIILQHRSPKTPVGLVRNAKRRGEEATLTTLGEFTNYPIDMFTLVIVGNSQTSVLGRFMVTPRGYIW